MGISDGSGVGSVDGITVECTSVGTSVGSSVNSWDDGRDVHAGVGTAVGYPLGSDEGLQAKPTWGKKGCNHNSYISHIKLSCCSDIA